MCENLDYCYVEMPEKDNEILKYSYGEKPIKAPFIIYADLESLLEKISTCHNNPEKSSATKINKHTPASYSLFTQCSFDKTKNRFDYYRGKDYLKNFCLDFRKYTTKIINHEKKKMIPLTKEKEYKCEEQKFYYICRKPLSANNKDTKYRKVKDHCHYTGKYRGAVHGICNLIYNIPREIPVVFYNGSTFDYHLIIKKLGEEFEGEFECLGENTKKYNTFSVPIKKETIKRDKDGSDEVVEILYKMKFIDSFRFMSTSLSNLVNNLSEGVYNDKCIDCKSHLDSCQ